MVGTVMLKPAPYAFTQRDTAEVAPNYDSTSLEAARMSETDGPGTASLAQPASEAGTRPLIIAPAAALEAEGIDEAEVAADIAGQTVQVMKLWMHTLLT